MGLLSLSESISMEAPKVAPVQLKEKVEPTYFENALIESAEANKRQYEALMEGIDVDTILDTINNWKAKSITELLKYTQDASDTKIKEVKNFRANNIDEDILGKINVERYRWTIGTTSTAPIIVNRFCFKDDLKVEQILADHTPESTKVKIISKINEELSHELSQINTWDEIRGSFLGRKTSVSSDQFGFECWKTFRGGGEKITSPISKEEFKQIVNRVHNRDITTEVSDEVDSINNSYRMFLKQYGNGKYSKYMKSASTDLNMVVMTYQSLKQQQLQKLCDLHFIVLSAKMAAAISCQAVDTAIIQQYIDFSQEV